jgi:ABC-2 type transport system permease protein
MTALTITTATLRRMLRDRVSLFFIVLLPIVVILIVGATVGGFDTFRAGMVSRDTGPLATSLVEDLRASSTVRIRPVDDEAGARTAVRRGELDLLVLIPAGFDATLRSGEPATVTVLAGGAPGTAAAARAAVDSVVAHHAARVQAARFATDRVGGDVETNLALAARTQADTPAVTVRTKAVERQSGILPTGFSYSAPTMLVLFVFINALAAGAAIIQTRRLGIYDRALAAPVTAGTIVLGETMAYFALAMLQSLLIVGVGAWVFGVSWGNPLAATLLVLVWALVGTGAGMLSGTLFRTPEQAGAIGPAAGIALGMLGGCMWPLAIVTPLMRTLGHAAPHAWAVDGWTTVLSADGGVGDIVVPLAVLAGFAATLLGLAVLRMRRRLVA